MQSHENLQTLHVGDRVRLSGGYDMEPDWLHGQSSYLGTLVAFILELRFVGAEWRTCATVHVELCDFMPEAKSWKYRRQGKWVESHATCMLAAPQDPDSLRC